MDSFYRGYARVVGGWLEKTGDGQRPGLSAGKAMGVGAGLGAGAGLGISAMSVGGQAADALAGLALERANQQSLANQLSGYMDTAKEWFARHPGKKGPAANRLTANVRQAVAEREHALASAAELGSVGRRLSAAGRVGWWKAKKVVSSPQFYALLAGMTALGGGLGLAHRWRKNKRRQEEQ